MHFYIFLPLIIVAMTPYSQKLLTDSDRTWETMGILEYWCNVWVFRDFDPLCGCPPPVTPPSSASAHPRTQAAQKSPSDHGPDGCGRLGVIEDCGV